MVSMMATMPNSVATSMRIVSAPAANISLITSTSVVRRGARRPAGVGAGGRGGGAEGDQPPDRGAVEEPRRQLLQMADEIEAQIAEALLRHQHHQIVLQIQ